jgi:hypothetical protein
MSEKPVVLLLRPALQRAVECAGAERFVTRVERELRTYMERRGFVARPSLRIEVDAASAVALRVDGQTLPYPPTFLLRLWFSVTPPALWRGELDGHAQRRYPDGWLITRSEELAAARDEEGCIAIGDLIAQLVLEIVALHPASLLTEEDAGPFRAVRAAAGGGASLLQSDADILQVLAGVVELGVGLGDRGRVSAALEGAVAVASSIADAVEALFARLRWHTLNVEMDPHTFRAMLTEDVSESSVLGTDERIKEEMRDAVGVVYEHRLSELGLRLPVRFEPVADFDRPEIRVRLNERTSPSIPVPAGDEVAVSATPQQLLEHGIASRPLLDAITGRQRAIVDAAACEQVEAAGFAWTPQFAYVAAAFARSVATMAYRLVSIDEVEEDLAALELEQGALVHAALSRYTLAKITRLLRELVREEVSVRDLRRILNALLAFNDTTVEELDVMFLDDALPDRAEETAVRAGADDARLLAYLRRELADRVCHDARLGVSGSAVELYSTDEALEADAASLLTPLGSPERDAIAGSIRERVWQILGAQHEPQERPQVLVTAARTRLALRDAIAFELPAVQVLAYGELPSPIDVDGSGPEIATARRELPGDASLSAPPATSDL